MTWGIVHMYDQRFTNLWDYLVTEAQIPMSWIYPNWGGDNGNVDEPWRTHINCVRDDLPGPFIVLSPQDGHNVKGQTSLYDFVHPEECYYVFGSDRHNMSLDDDAIKLHETEVQTVYIPDIGNRMYSVECASMVVYDRRLKQWQS